MKNKLLRRIILFFLAVILIFTFISQSVYKASLPVVTCVKTTRGSISQTETVQGELFYQDATEDSASDAWHIVKVAVQNGQTVKAGDPLFSIDTAPYEVQKRTYELDLMTVEHSIAELDTQILTKQERQYSNQELSAKKGLLNLQLDTLKSKYPATGVINAKTSGIVDAVSIKSGDTVANGQVCVSMHAPGAKLFVRYSLPIESMEKFQSVGELNVSYKASHQDKDSESSLLTTETELAKIEESRLSDDGTKWDFTASLEKTVNQPFIHDPASVKLASHSTTYENVVPASCVKTGDKGNYVLTLNERSSLFGMEYYVKEVDVDILSQNDELTAIKSKELVQFLNIVATTTLPLNNGSTVLVQQ